jgi:hypothetical protein
MARPKSGKKRYNFLINSDTYEEFSKICGELGLVRSKKLEIYMKRFIEEHEELLRKLKGGKSKGEKQK